MILIFSVNVLIKSFFSQFNKSHISFIKFKSSIWVISFFEINVILPIKITDAVIFKINSISSSLNPVIWKHSIVSLNKFRSSIESILKQLLLFK